MGWGLLLALILWALSTGVAPTKAMASEPLVLPGAWGEYATCSLRLWGVDQTGAPRAQVSCLYGPVFVGGLATKVTGFGFNMGPFTCTGGCVNAGTHTISPFTTYSVGGGYYRGSFVPANSNVLGTLAGPNYANSCTVTIDQNVGNKPCIFTSIVYNNAQVAYPDYPNGYYEGAEDPNLVPIPCFEFAPMKPVYRTELAKMEMMEFDATCSLNVKAGATFAWTFPGDWTLQPNMTGRVVQARPPTPTTCSEADVTLNVTEGGVVYKVTVTITFCHDKAQYLEDDGGLDSSDCPTGIGLLNPFSIVKVLQCLFIPTQVDLLLDDLNNEAQQHWPVGPATATFELFGSGIHGFRAGVEHGIQHPQEECNLGPDIDLTGGGSQDAVKVTIIPGVGTDCATGQPDRDAPEGWAAFASSIRTFTTILIYAAGLVFFLGLVGSLLGVKLSGGGSDEE